MTNTLTIQVLRITDNIVSQSSPHIVGIVQCMLIRNFLRLLHRQSPEMEIIELNADRNNFNDIHSYVWECKIDISIEHPK